MRADARVVISASHNPYHDNGIKIFGPDGFKLPDAEEAEIERLMDSQDLDEAKGTGAAGHGAAYVVAPAVFTELGAEVLALGVKPNGRNINRDAGALHPEHVAHEVVRRGAALGIALDGDADRVIMVDERGR